MLPLKPVKRIFTKRLRRPAPLTAPLPFFILLVFSCLPLVLEGCAPSRPHLPYPLSERTVVSSDGYLRLRIPEGWFVPVDGESSQGLLVWLVKEDYSATMGLTEIRGDERLRKEVEETGLLVLGELSFSLKQARDPAAKLLSLPEVFQLNRKRFCAYEFASDNGATTIRTVVFDTGKKFYELTVIPNPKKMPVAMRPIFDAQQAILQMMDW